MPPPRRAVTLALLTASACTPSQFAWRDAPAEVAAYRASFAAAAGDRLDAAASRAEWLAASSRVRVLWLGDHHRSERLHVLHRQLLRDLHRSGVRLALALEAIGEQDEPWVRAFVAGRVDSELLRARMRQRWAGSWLDDAQLDAAYFRDVLDFARTFRLPVAALEPTPRLPLAARDARIAANVAAFAAAHPERLVVAVVGQAHLAGAGDVVRRCGLPAVVVGAEPPAALLAAPPPVAGPPAAGAMWRSSGGLWWFAALWAEGAGGVSEPRRRARRPAPARRARRRDRPRRASGS
jgi:hypothetical protein